MTVANKVEHDLGLGQFELPMEPLEENETFLWVERALLLTCRKRAVQGGDSGLAAIGRVSDSSRFWADVIPAIQARWALISSRRGGFD